MRYERDALHLVLANNGGWLIERYDGVNDRNLLVAAYSDDEALLKAFPGYLLEWRKSRLRKDPDAKEAL